MKKEFILKKYTSHFWGVADLEIYEDGELVETVGINCFYKVTPEFVEIYDTTGGSGTGFNQGDLTRRVNISGCEFRTVSTPTRYDETNL